MPDDHGDARPRAGQDRTPGATHARPRRAHRVGQRSNASTPDTSAARLTAAVLTASKGCRIELDEHYTLTAFVVHRAADDDPATDPAPPIVVELLDHGAASGSTRWQATAYDELSGRATGLGHGATVEQALKQLDWHVID